MKTLKYFSKTIAKIGVSIFSFVAISCILFGGVLIHQSCTQDTIKPLKTSEHKLAFSESKQDLVFSEFESLLNSVSPKIQNIADKHQYMMNDINIEENNAVDELEAKELLMPLVVGAKKLLSTFDISEEDLQKEFSDPNDPRIALIGLVMFAEKDKLNKNREFSVSGDLYDCALRTFGITAITQALDRGLSSRAGKRLLKKAIRKIASKALGWAGAAWAVYEFGDCMDWW